jgi:hypothetical protein
MAQRMPPTITWPVNLTAVVSTGGQYGSSNGSRAQAGSIATAAAASSP